MCLVDAHLSLSLSTILLSFKLSPVEPFWLLTLGSNALPGNVVSAASVELFLHHLRTFLCSDTSQGVLLALWLLGHHKKDLSDWMIEWLSDFVGRSVMVLRRLVSWWCDMQLNWQMADWLRLSAHGDSTSLIPWNRSFCQRVGRWTIVMISSGALSMMCCIMLDMVHSWTHQTDFKNPVFMRGSRATVWIRCWNKSCQYKQLLKCKVEAREL